MLFNKNYTEASINNPINKDYTKGISTAKAIGIFLVVLGHTCKNEQLMKMIYFFHMPLFFIISGILFNAKKYDGFRYFLKDSIKTLLFPYVTFYTLSFIYWYFIEKQSGPGDLQIPNIKPIIGFFYGTYNLEYMIVNNALWFLCALFISKILLYFAVKYFKTNKSTLVILAFSALLGYYLSVTNFYKLFFSINSAFIAFFFVGIGYLCRTNFEKGKAILLRLKPIILLLAVFIACIAVKFNPITNLGAAKYGIFIIYILGGLAGSYLCFTVSRNLKERKAVVYFGNNSLIIFGLSEPIRRGFTNVFSKISHLSINDIRFSIGYSMVCTILILTLLIPIIYIFNNYLYVFIGKSKPGSFKENHFTPLQSVYQQSL